ncbi:protein phosphatase [Phaffia rhodozyma]|uniref:Protein phosphatase n=1 Tax=Phaffia rhodozyma TaxID=264483 RepID=A0A0F7STJ1_PHARH|nr:protein phosphatase [Phaffia rhodozyma]
MSPDSKPHPVLPHDDYEKACKGGPTRRFSQDGQQVTNPIDTKSPLPMETPASQNPPSSIGKADYLKPDNSPNAKSQDITVADGSDTGGALNRHPQPAASALLSTIPAAPTSASNDPISALPTFRVGVSEDRNKRCRRSMEDAHSFIYDFGGVEGQGYFAVFDGHAGKHAAEWCGAHFHECLLEKLSSDGSSLSVPDILNQTFLAVDSELSKLAQEEKTHSGCTAVVAFLRVDEPAAESDGTITESLGAISPEPVNSTENSTDPEEEKSRLTRMKGVFGKITGGSGNGGGLFSSKKGDSSGLASGAPVIRKSGAKRTLFTANVGDARAVISRRGKAVRLTYDHKGSDEQEAKRITDAGGFVMNNRVNGVLAVTRALGDASVKEFVVGNPYTTETRLDEGDEFLIVACDGLWDVTEDQQAVDLIANVEDPQEASKILLDHALESYTTDNLSVLVIRLNPTNV